MNSKQLFTKKLRAKQGAKIKLFKILLIQGYLLWYATFFGGTFSNFLKSFTIGMQ